MEEKKIEVLFTIIIAVFIIALVGSAAWWMGNQSTGAPSVGENNSNTTTTGGSGPDSLFSTPDPSMEAKKTEMRGLITVNGETPEMQQKKLADGTAYGGFIRLNYSQEHKYAMLTGGVGSTGGLIDMSGSYVVDDVCQGVPFTVTVTLFEEKEEEPFFSVITGDNGNGNGNPRQFTLNGPLVQNFSLSA
jgi:hypothetical protein